MRAPIFGMKGSGSVKVSGKDVVEARGDVAAKLDMLLLVLAHGDQICLIERECPPPSERDT